MADDGRALRAAILSTEVQTANHDDSCVASLHIMLHQDSYPIHRCIRILTTQYHILFQHPPNDDETTSDVRRPVPRALCLRSRRMLLGSRNVYII